MAQQRNSTTLISRRRVLALGAPAILALSPLSKVAQAATNPERKLAFFNIHTGEKLNTVYRVGDQLVQPALAEIDHILRDWRTEEELPIDRSLLDLLYSLRHKMDANEPFHVISGYRSPKTNEKLRKQGSGGVAKKSLHMQGMAIDIALPGRRLADLRDAAKSLKLGGVGYYPSPGFVHVDVGRVRYW